MKLDLGCGRRKHEGCIGIDRDKNSDADIVWELNKGMPPKIKPDNVDEVWAVHFLEHCDDWIYMVKEIHRVCKNKARVHIVVPHCLSPLAFVDPEHKHFFAFNTFDYFCIPGVFPVFRLIQKGWDMHGNWGASWRARFAKSLVKLTGGIRGPFRHFIDVLWFELEVVK